MINVYFFVTLPAAPSGAEAPPEPAAPAGSEVQVVAPRKTSKKTTIAGILKYIITKPRGTQQNDPAASASVSITPEQRVVMEINGYLSLPPSPENEDPLLWWKISKRQFPLLASVAKKILCIPATSVPSERAFSTAGHILSPQRNRLGVETLNMLCFLHHNLP